MNSIVLNPKEPHLTRIIPMQVDIEYFGWNVYEGTGINHQIVIHLPLGLIKSQYSK